MSPSAARTPVGPSVAGETPWFATVVHVTFFLLLGSSLARFILRHPGNSDIRWIAILTCAVALLYAIGPGRSDPQPLWLGGCVAGWVVLVLATPSFAWCAVPLVYAGLRTLSTRAALILITLLTSFTVFAQVRLMRISGFFDPNVLVAPPAVAAMAAAVFIQMQRQAAAQQALSEELAATERRAGVLAERERLAAEIHDTLAQGSSSVRMLLQAADRVWDADPVGARRHVHTAVDISERNLTEARRFVHDLAPADLAGGASLGDALRALAGRQHSIEVRFHQEGAAVPLPAQVEAALLRIAQGALANVTEHAEARTAGVTLSYLGDQVVLDIADDGRGMVEGIEGSPERGHGLPAMRARLRQLGGQLTVESTPGEGTYISASIPLEGP